METKGYMRAAETAKMIKASLKEAFPGVKWSVRSDSYSGGSSINVGWTDGPNEAQVKAITNRFEGSYFDGMIDYKGNRYHTLDGKPISIHCDFVFENREYSLAMVERAFAAVRQHYGDKDMPDVKKWKAAYNERDPNWDKSPISNITGWDSHWNWSSLVYRDLHKRSTMLAKDSPTAKRIACTGDDGYGAGTVGPDGKGPGYGGYPGTSSNSSDPRVAKANADANLETMPTVGGVQ